MSSIIANRTASPMREPDLPPDMAPRGVWMDPTADPLSRFGGKVRALVWPTRTLETQQRWFDELYVWTSDFEPDRSLRSQIQLAAFEHAFAMLWHERVDRMAVTLSFGTVERSWEALAGVIAANAMTAHRMSVMFRGTIERMRFDYRVREFIDLVRSYRIPVGYRFAEPRPSMELAAIEFVRPDFTKMLSPISVRDELWAELARDVDAMDLSRETFILAGIERAEQLTLARRNGFVLGQGRALRKPYFPPRLLKARAT